MNVHPGDGVTAAAGRLAGAALDVFETEPLAAGQELTNLVDKSQWF